MNLKEKAVQLLKEFKGDNYVYGRDILKKIGPMAAKAGKTAVLIRGTFPRSDEYIESIKASLSGAGVELLHIEKGARPNAPREDLERISDMLKNFKPDVVISFGGGSTIDCVKAAEVLRTLGGSIEDYFGTGKVSEMLKKKGKSLSTHIAVQTAASSAAHLTKYANITDIQSGQKKLIVDEAIVPDYPLFDYSMTYAAPQALTMDGALDGIAHLLEVLYGAHKAPIYPKVKEIAHTGISLIVENLPTVLSESGNPEARDALCLGTDLGGYAIMVGGTNGGHLTSFSLVDILSHGRACALMNPYYTVFFAPAVENGLRMVGNIYKSFGYSKADFDLLKGRELGVAAANAMFALSERIGFPTVLKEVQGFRDAHIARALSAAKDPQLKMKLLNMPVPMDIDTVDLYMGSILESAKTGNLDVIRMMEES